MKKYIIVAILLVWGGVCLANDSLYSNLFIKYLLNEEKEPLIPNTKEKNEIKSAYNEALMKSRLQQNSQLSDFLILNARKLGIAKIEDDDTSAEKSFKDLGFDVGLSMMIVMDQEKPIRDAKIREGKVLITEHAETTIAPILQMHQFFTNRDKTFGYGPFVAIGIGESQVIQTFAFGAMVGLRSSQDTGQSFNLGIGWYWEPKAKFLAPGFEEGIEVGDNVQAVETVEKTAQGLSITISYKF